jgi:hypothetical protein
MVNQPMSLHLSASNSKFFSGERTGDVVFRADNNARRILLGNKRDALPMLTLSDNAAIVGGNLRTANISTNLVNSTGIVIGMSDALDASTPEYAASTTDAAFYASNAVAQGLRGIHSGGSNMVFVNTFMASNLAVAGSLSAGLFGASNVVVKDGGPAAVTVVSTPGVGAYMQFLSDSASNCVCTIGVDGSPNRYSIGTTTDHDITFSTNSTQRMCITHSGNVGVGTATPGQSLDVTGSAYVSSNLVAGYSVSVGSTSINDTAISNSASFEVNSKHVLTLHSDNGNLNDGANIQLTCGDTEVVYIDKHSMAPNADNGANLGKSTHRFNYAYSTNGVIQTSDSAEKDYVPLEYGLASLAHVETIKYKWKSQAALPADDPSKHYEYYGIRADQLNTLFPELVYNATTPYQINYSELIPVCINAIQELNAQVRELRQALMDATDLRA